MLSEFLVSKRKRWSYYLAKWLMQCDVDPKARIGKNIKFGHGGRGVIIGNATIGNNVTIMHNVTIANNFLAKNEKGKEFPKIGNNVTIGTGR